MSQAAAERLPRGRSGFPQAVRMEWVKARTLRSTWWITALTLAGTIGLAIVVMRWYPSHWSTMSRADRASFDPVNDGFTGLAVAQLLMASFGVLAITSEYSGGMIRTTLAAMPRRPVVLAAKAAVIGGIALVAGEIAAFGAFFAGEAMLISPVPHVTLGQPHVLQAVLLAGAYLFLMALTGVGVGAIVRRSAAGVAVIAGVIFVLPLITMALPDSFQHSVQKFFPEMIAENSLTMVKPGFYALSAWAGLGMLCLYAAVLLGAGTWLLARRDA